MRLYFSFGFVARNVHDVPVLLSLDFTNATHATPTRYIFASCDAGIANVPVKGGEWNVIPPGGWGRGGYLTVSDSLVTTSVLGGCLGGHVWLGTVVNTTHVNAHL
jgi:hypothetical protein